MAVHESRVCWALLVSDKRSDLWPAGVDVASFDQQLLGNLFIRYDDKLLVHGACVVDRAMFGGPLLKLEPKREPGEVMDAAHDGVLLWSWKPGLGSDTLPPRENLLDRREEEAGDGQVEQDQGETLHLGSREGRSPAGSHLVKGNGRRRRRGGGSCTEAARVLIPTAIYWWCHK